MTNHAKISITTIDKNAQVCYTGIKLENKTNILTSNKQKQTIIKQKGNNNMAKQYKLNYNLGFQIFKDEADYASPATISKEAARKIGNYANMSIL